MRTLGYFYISVLSLFLCNTGTNNNGASLLASAFVITTAPPPRPVIRRTLSSSSSASAAAAASTRTCRLLSATSTDDSTTTTTTTTTTATTTGSSGSGVAKVLFVAGDAPSGYGRTSPEPDPSWSVVAAQLSRRLPNFGGRNEEDGSDKISATWLHVSELAVPGGLTGFDVVVALGIDVDDDEARLLEALEAAAGGVKAFVADPTCGETTQNRQFADAYESSNVFHNIVSNIVPWSSLASGKRLLDKTSGTLLGRKSSEDYIFAVLFLVHSIGICSLDVVKSDINPSWEKGVLRNAQEFKTMVDCCGPQIQAALSDPQTKKAIDLLNAVDLRDQVGSYRVIVSNETPQLEEFTLCILQQNNCFQCDAPILDKPRVPLLRTWPQPPPQEEEPFTATLSEEAARQILIGHLDHPDAHPVHSRRKPWSWKVVVGANPAYDAFPMQHQVFYPVGDGKNSKSLWYDPVFCVETLGGDRVWCKRHYRCTPRKHWSGTTPGAWTLTTLDNGMVSDEKWTTVDAADDLGWVVLHYSGAARRAGQSYVGALLCTPDGLWPKTTGNGDDDQLLLERIRGAFRKCDLELWELFGGSTEESYMWSNEYTDWKKDNPPPLDPIGDISINAWRKREREKELDRTKK